MPFVPQPTTTQNHLDSFMANTQSLSLGSRLCGISMRLHFSFVPLLLFAVYFGLLLSFGPLFVFLVFLLYGPILFITIVVHELGHALVAKKFGGQVGTIVLWPLGGIVICGATQDGVKEDLFVALAGPLAHIPQALIWLIIFVIATGGDFTFFVTQTAASQPVYPSVLSNGFGGFMTVLSARAFWLNLYIMALNLFLPAFPLDGGRCLANILVLCGKSVERAARVTAITSLAVGSVMILFGVITYFCFLNCSFLLVVWIGATIVLSGKKLLDMVRDGRLAQHPLFGRECYTERQQQQQESQPEMTPQEQAAAEVI